MKKRINLLAALILGLSFGPAAAADQFIYVDPVPTMGEWFLAALAALVIGIGYVMLNRRQQVEQV